ncbi:hypothetical protein SAMN04488137_3714 [Fictibacillus solisalsi]|uniref:Uncharacterized protein n=1 Tax=Fictibacillus solisalsi TaxID=459525 RepID=A0A1G9ZRE0_9BACL|nr:hypothetical protein GA0061096_4168 [Fictibacillus enclensis]SDN24162.1 hypothetical protein SAMN04488137_3714 [Fictibacillus solisalsi]
MVLFSPMVVNMLGFKVNTMDRSATLGFGPVQQLDLFSSNKINQGFGEDNGDLTVVNLPIIWVADQDVIDSNSVKNSVL